MRTITKIFFISSFVIAAFAVVAGDGLADNHGDEFSSATTVALGSVTNGDVDVGGDLDYFKFTVNETATYVMYTRGYTDTHGVLYDSDYQHIETDWYDGEEDNFRIARELNPGTYYVQVSGDLSNTTGSYTFHLDFDGDINKDGQIDLTDAILVLQVLAGLEPALPVYKQADVNEDGKIGLEEVIYILQKVSGLREK